MPPEGSPPSFRPQDAKPRKPPPPGAVARNEILRTSKRVARFIWGRWNGYRRRSRAEAKLHYVKLRGRRLSFRDLDRQLAEFQVRVPVLNGFTTSAFPSQTSRDKSVAGKGSPTVTRFVHRAVKSDQH